MALPVVFVLFLASASGMDLVANHACEVNGTYYITNCCSRSEIFFCFSQACWVAHGCVICEPDRCWHLVAAGVVVPEGQPLRRDLGPGLPWVLLTAYVCDSLGAGEICAVCTVGYQFVRSGFGWQPNAICDRPCDLKWNATLVGLWQLPARGFMQLIWEVFIGIPRAVWQALWAGHGIVVLLMLIYLLEERPIKAIFMLVLLIFQFHDAASFSLSRLGLYDTRSRDDFLPCFPIYKDGARYSINYSHPINSWAEYGKSGTAGRWWCQNGMMSWNHTTDHGTRYVLDGEVNGPFCTHQLSVNGSWTGRTPDCLFEVICLQGSVLTWAARRYVFDTVPATEWSSRCFIFAGPSAGKDIATRHTCIVDKRAKWCGKCVRDCWETTGDPQMTYDHCGTGSRLTQNLRVMSQCRWSAKHHRFVNDLGKSFRIPGANTKECEGKVLIKAGAGFHAVDCVDGGNYSLPRYMPGTPVRRVGDTRWFPFMLLGPPVPWGVREDYYNVCRGYAFRWEDKMDGLIHVNRFAKNSRQSIESGTPPAGYFLCDFFVLLLILMKLMGARWTPLLCLLIWLQLAPPALGRLFVCKQNNCMGVNWTHAGELARTGVSKVKNVAQQSVESMKAGAQSALSALEHGLRVGVRGVGTALMTVGNALNATSFSGMKAEAAIAPWVGAGPMLAATRLDTSVMHVVLLVLNGILYYKSRGFGRMSAMVGFKLYRGWFAAAIFAMVGYSRRRHSAAGCKICIELDYETGWDISWSLAVVVSYALVTLATFSKSGKRLKLELYASWARVYGRIYGFVVECPLGQPPGKLVTGTWWLACLLWPLETLCVAVWLYTAISAVDALDMTFEAMLCVEPQLPRLARLVETLAETRNIWAVKRLLDAMGAHGVWLYDHMGQVGEKTKKLLLDAHACLEPAFVGPRDLEEVRDDQFVLACGCVYGGKPVVARRGDSVLIGHARGIWDLPPGYKLTAPLLLRREGKNAYRVLLTSLRGTDESEHPGQIIRLGTALTRSFGTCVNGMMYTTLHGTNGKSMATCDGPVYPRWTTASEDIAVYPMPKGASSLEVCGCSTASAWCLTKEGQLCHGRLSGDSLLLDTDRRISEIKGASGSPILCDKGHVMGLLIAAKHTGPRVHSVRFSRPWEIRPADTTAPTTKADLPLPGDKYRAEALICPTGSGKSTRIPVEYARMGYKVLVVNPSVATTAAMLKHIPEAYKIQPSIFAGSGSTAVSIAGGSKLTYCTYGRLLAGNFSLLRDVDVVILDECHSTDPTVLLGAGGVGVEALKMGVKLVLYATATPPGCHVQPHPNIREEALTTDGDIAFYGVTLKSSDYLHGRHLIFCHSKAECERLATELSKFRCKTVTFYRGKDISVVPTSGDIVVVATDALSTGYTGNFDTVTDCCTVIEEAVDVDLSPTITISLKTKPCSAALRMQRRGRTGRGRQGLYRYALPETPPSATAPSGALWAAAEMAVVWYNFPDTRIQSYLESYNSCPWTCILDGAVQDPIRYFSVLREFKDGPYVQGMLAQGYTWPLISGVQMSLCVSSGSGRPNDDPRWTPITGKGPVPLIAIWGNTQTPARVEHPLVRLLQQALGVPTESLTTGPALLVGAAVACAAALVNYTGCVVAIAAWSVGEAGDGHMAVTDFVLEEALTAVETQVSWDACVDGMRQMMVLGQQRIAAGVSAAAKWWGPIPASKESWLLVISRLLNSWASSITAGVAILTSGTNPTLASFSMFASGLMSTLPCETHVVLAALSGAICSLLGGPAAGLAVAGAFLAGGMVGQTASLTSVIGGVCGWEAAVTGAHIAFAGMNGTLNKELLTRAVACLASPGAAIAGGVIGVILYHTSASASTQKWTNRLLSAVPRSNVLPDGFYDSGDPKEKVELLLKRVSLVELVKTLLETLEHEGEAQCVGVWEFAGDLIHWLRGLIEWAISRLRDFAPSLKVPLVSCQKPYYGAWRGSGGVQAVCPCGNTVNLQIAEGTVVWRSDSKRFCSSALGGGVPINTMGSSRGPVPADVPLQGGVVARFPYSYTDWVEIRYMPTGMELWATTTPTLTRECLMAAIRQQPCLINGVSRSWKNYHTPAQMVLTSGATVVYAGTPVKLPHRLAPEISLLQGTHYQDNGSEITSISETPTPPPIFSVNPLMGGEEVNFIRPPDAPGDAPVRVWVSGRATIGEFCKWYADWIHTDLMVVERGGVRLEYSEPLTRDTFTLLMPAKYGTEHRGTVRGIPQQAWEAVVPEKSAPVLAESQQWCYFHLRCCGMDAVMGFEWRDQRTLRETAMTGFERDSFLAEYWGEPFKVWDEGTLTSHIPQLNGTTVGWEALNSNPAAQTTNTITLRCNGERTPQPVQPRFSEAAPCDTDCCCHVNLGSDIDLHLWFSPGCSLVEMLPNSANRRFVYTGEPVTDESTYTVDGWRFAGHADDIGPQVLLADNAEKGTSNPKGGKLLLAYIDEHELWCDGKLYSWREPQPQTWKEWKMVCKAEKPRPFTPDPPSEPPELEMEEIELVPLTSVVEDCCLKKQCSILVKRMVPWQEQVVPHLAMQVEGHVGPRYTEKHILLADGVPVKWDDIPRELSYKTLTLQHAEPDDAVVVELEAPCCKIRKTVGVPEKVAVHQALERAGIPLAHLVHWKGAKLAPFDEITREHDGETFLLECVGEETPCVQSYLWSGAPLGLRELTRRPPTNPVGAMLKADPGKAYRTDPACIGERIATVTREQVVAVEDKYLIDAYNLALANAAKITSPGMTYEEAISKVRPKAAPGHNAKLSVKDLKTDRGKAIVMECLADIKAERNPHPFCIAAKQEVFPQTKKTKKPPRIICYPSLEFRVAEKMIMGDPGKVAKAVVGKAYGFVSPKERCQRMINMWKSKRHPMAITVDAKVFDSTITGADVARETEIYAAASDDPDTVRKLGKRYASGQMVNSSGVVVGWRNCRASGVLTTSASNTITSYIKVSAACRAVGVPDPSFLIAGDDCLIVCEECDKVTELKMKLAEYGYDSEPQAHASLTTAETCSTFVAETYTDKKEYVLSTKMEKAIARASSEWSDPVAVAGGYTLLYPHHPITRFLLIVQLLTHLFKSGKSPRDEIVCEVQGNRLRFPLLKLPNILVGLHGPGALRVRSDSSKTLAETHKALQIMGCRGLGWYKRRWTRLRVALLRASPEWRYLARTLMWTPADGTPPTVEPIDPEELEFLESPYQGYTYNLACKPKKQMSFIVAIGIFCLTALAAVLAA